jgi:hypothetical protein
LQVFRFDPQAAFWRVAAMMLFMYGMTIALVSGALRGNEAWHILRDIVPFLFLLSPFFMPAFERDGCAQAWVLRAVIAVGLIFALRALAVFSGDVPMLLSYVFGPQEALSYLANAPTVLFAALFLMGWGGFLLSAAQSCDAGAGDRAVLSRMEYVRAVVR